MTASGQLEGTRSEGTCSYKGIPYAAPPVGPLRFRPPEPPVAWTDVRVADDFGEPCVQRAHGGPTGSEDCLTLNVWTPVERTEPLPILFYIHGGSNVSGSSAEYSEGAYWYEGSYLAEHGPAVVVTANYRLGSLGFLVHDSLAAEDAHGVSGNYGILDQLAALQWISDNAGSFGGDPSRILVFGQSAGAVDTCALVVSPLARGLFHRAMLLSGDCSASTEAQATRAGQGVVAALECDASPDVAACLRADSPEDITRAPVVFGNAGDLGYNGPSVDGYLLPVYPRAAVRNGSHEHMPMVFSSTAEEATTLVDVPSYQLPVVTTEASYRRAISIMYGRVAVDALVDLYPSSKYGTPRDAYIALLTDDWYTCTVRRDLRAVTTGQTQPVWRAYFAHTFEQGPARAYGAGHGVDLYFGFHSFGTQPTTAAELALADAMVGYWTRFAATGDPNGADAFAWPSYDRAQDDALVLDDHLSVVGPIDADECDYWDWYRGR